MASNIPVFIITGFLGSGKTLLNRLIHDSSMANSATSSMNAVPSRPTSVGNDLGEVNACN